MIIQVEGLSIYKSKENRMNYNRDNRGRFSRKWKVAGFLTLVAIGAFFIWGHPMVIQMLDSAMKGSTVEAVNSFVAEAAVDANMAEKTAEELREEMAGKIWDAESKKYQPEPGEVFHTFDPNKAMYERCIKIGGKRPIDCDSYGPMQIKIGTIQHFWPKMYNGAEISQLDAIAMTQDVEKSKKFFTDCAVLVEGCVWEWTTASKHEEYFKVVIPVIRKLEGK